MKLYLQSADGKAPLGRTSLRETFPPGLSIETPDVACVFLVGENGSGKTTVLKAALELGRTSVRQETREEKAERIGLNVVAGKPSRLFHWFSDNNPLQRAGYIESGAQVAAHFASHGQVQSAVMQQLPTDDGPCVLMIDEPESGLSIRNQVALAEWLSEWAREPDRLIVTATHCHLLMSRWPLSSCVIDLDRRPATVRTTDEYLKEAGKLTCA